MISIKSVVSVSGNNAPKIRNFRQEGVLQSKYFDIKYIAEDFENTILRHYIYIDGKKQEITKNVGYEQLSNEFTYRVNNLIFNTKYEIQIEVTDGLETVRSDILSVMTSSNPIYGIRVMENNSNPETSVTYINDAIGVSPATQTTLGGWVDKYPFNKIRIVGFKDGKVVKEIKKDNKAQYTDGSIVPTDVDVMVEIPKVYWKFTKISNGYEVQISGGKFEGSDCYAHKVGDIEKDFIYIGAYLGYLQNLKLRSISDYPISTNISLGNARNNCRANGSGYQQLNWYSICIIQILYLIAYKNLDSQVALGYGNVALDGNKKTTGGSKNKGFVFGGNRYEQMCFLGIEDLWGNCWQWVDGIFCDKNRNVLISPDNKTFNDNGLGYTKVGQLSSLNGRISKVHGTNQLCFLPIETNGSDTTYYCDYGSISSMSVPSFGGAVNQNLYCGIFDLSLGRTPTIPNTGIAIRLCYLGT